MNKFVTVLGVAAVATLAGCKDPDYKPMSITSTGVTDITTEPDTPPAIVSEPTYDIPPAPPVTCKCPPGTKHTSPCTCGAPDCKCVVELPPPPPKEPEYTSYIVQRGDYLAKISKKYNIKVESIKKLNGMTDDKILLGQTIKLPGKVDVGEQTVPAPARAIKDAGAKSGSSKKTYEPYTGETKEYVVKGGDMLGGIAHRNGITVRQLKDLNGLTSDAIRVGQKLKVPAAGKTASSAAETKVPAEKKVVTSKSDPVVEPVKDAADKPVVEPIKDEAPAVPVETTTVVTGKVETPSVEYVVREGDDLTGLSIDYDIPVSAICELNHLSQDAQLTPGQVIKLPVEAQQ